MSRQDPRDSMNKTQAVANYLKQHGRIDRTTAFVRFKTFSLPQIISRLPKRGLKTATLKDKNGTTYYKLIE